MAVRQYVGARYVPKFASPVEWQANTAYEALTIVSYNNSSYTSKIPVPATVGNPADNDTYWVLTGNYNAQVEDYRQITTQVQEGLNEEISNREEAGQAETAARENADTTLQNNIDLVQNHIDNRFYICIADSYGMRNTVTWTTLMKDRYGDNCIQSSTSGAGFLPTNNTFLEHLQGVVQTLTSEKKNKVTDVVVCGGWNDARAIAQGSTPSELQQAIFALVKYVNENLPNAIPWVGFIAWQTGTNTQPQVTVQNLLTTKGIYQRSPYKNLHFINAMNVMQNTFFMDESEFHPSNAGGEQLFYAIASCLNGGSYNFSYRLGFDLASENYFTPYEGTTIQTSGVESECVNGISILKPLGVIVATVPYTASPESGLSHYILGTFGANVLPYGHNGTFAFNMTFNGTRDGEAYVGTLYAAIDKNRRFYFYDNDTANQHTYNGWFNFNAVVNSDTVH